MRASAYPTDVSKSDQVDGRSRRASPTSGRLDIVVNNAGISRVGPHTQDVTDEDWHDSIAVMQTGVFYCMRAAGRIMIDAGLGLGDQHLVDPRLLAEPGPDDLLRAQGGRDHDDQDRRRRVGAARRPRATRSRRACCARRCGTPTSPAAPSTSRFYLDMVPAKRLGMPSEVGALAVYLASDDASYVNGSIIPIDGALTAIPAG